MSPTTCTIESSLVRLKAVEKILQQKGLVTEDELLALQEKYQHDFEPILKPIEEEINPLVSLANSIAKKENTQ